MRIKLHFLAAVAFLFTLNSISRAQVISASEGVGGGLSKPELSPINNMAPDRLTTSLMAPGKSSKKKDKQLGNAFSGEVLGVGIGFLSGITNIYNASDLTYLMPTSISSSAAPGFGIFYEHSLSHAIGIGLNINYQSANTTFTTAGWSYSPNTGAISFYTNTYSWHLSMPTFLARGAFHFTAGTKIDPYVGLNLGYCMVSTSQTFQTNDPNINTPGDANAPIAEPVGLSAVEYGLFAGGRFFIVDNFGAWLEFRYSTVTLTSWNLNVNVNPATFLNVGVCVKL